MKLTKIILFRLQFLVGFFLGFLALAAQSDPFCFSRAQSYYEQVYCELQAKAQLQGLPGFEEFKNNSEPVQYSLLKRPAERNRIKLPRPKATLQKAPVAEALPSRLHREHEGSAAGHMQQAQFQASAVAASDACILSGKEIHCGANSYQAQGNLRNSRLSSGALDSDNPMAIPERASGQSDSDYLLTAYVQYLRKMREIGLGGVTMTYGKFAFLYRDLGERGLNFSQRFETMFGFLKKDKATLGVSEGVSLPQGLQSQDCVPVAEDMVTCSYQGRNYLFVNQ